MTNRQWLETLTDEELAKWRLSAGVKVVRIPPKKVFAITLAASFHLTQTAVLTVQ